MADNESSGSGATTPGSTAASSSEPEVVDLVNPQSKSKSKSKTRQSSLMPANAPIVPPPVSTSGERSPTWLFFNIFSEADEKGKNVQCIIERKNNNGLTVICGSKYKIKDFRHGVGNLNRCVT